MDILDFTIRLFTAIGGGLLIGLERQWHNKAAGLRTNALVAGGAAIYVLLSISITENGSGDVTRIIGQVVTGIGFIGAGIIFKEGISVKGLTTAATVWCSSAIGSIAAGYFYETAIGVGAIIFINSLLLPVDRWFYKRHNNQHYDE